MRARGARHAWAARRLFGLCCVLLVVAASVASATANARTLTISPLNGTPDASPGTQISFLGVPANEIAQVSVVGSRSGGHSGKLRSYVSSAGASFLPSAGFSQGEGESLVLRDGLLELPSRFEQLLLERADSLGCILQAAAERHHLVFQGRKLLP